MRSSKKDSRTGRPIDRRPDHRIVAAFFLIIGTSCIVTGLFWNRISTWSSSSHASLAKLQRETGKVQIFRQKQLAWELLQNQAELFAGDQVQTDEVGEAILVFNDGEQAKVLHDSVIAIESGQQGNISLLVRRGDVRRLDTEVVVNIHAQSYVVKNSQKIPLAQYNESDLSNASIVEEVNPEKKVGTPVANPLEEKEISQMISSKRGQLFKCYAQLLQKNPSQKGEMQVGMTIQPNGKVASVFVTSTSLNEENLKKCVTSILSQIQFRAFAGDPVTARLPLKFE